MYTKLSSISKRAKYSLLNQSTATTALKTTSKAVIVEERSQIKRWIIGMLIGSTPFLVILACWMFVSLCINNLVRLIQKRQAKNRDCTPTSEMKSFVSRVNV